MQKAILIFLGLLALSTAATIFAEGDESTKAPVVTPNPEDTTAGPVVTPDPAETTAGPVVTPDPAETTAGPVVTPDPAETTAGPVVTPDPEDSSEGPVVTPDPNETTAVPVVTPDPEDSSEGPVVTPDPAETTAVPIVTPGQTTLAPVNPTNPTTGTTVEEKCLFESQTWAVADPRSFSFCQNGKPYLYPCNEGSYFVNNGTVSGCIPEAKMKASCVNLDVEVGPCEGINLKQPQPSKVLTNFWFCKGADAQPVELTCTDNMAFINRDGYLGCFTWTEWRAIRGCNN